MLTKRDIQYLEDNFASKEDLISFKDAILGEIKAMREELSIVIGYRQLIEDHDQRIEKLERTVSPAI